jgi:hypothetical protein
MLSIEDARKIAVALGADSDDCVVANIALAMSKQFPAFTWRVRSDYGNTEDGVPMVEVISNG